MKPATPTNSLTFESVKKQCSDNTPPGVIEQIAAQMDRAAEAKRRIETEGIVVRDMKGSVIAHPAIKIEQDACKMITDLLTRHGKRGGI